MSPRLHCCVPFCRRTTARFQPPTEWICGRHWQLVSKDKRRVYGRRKRAWRRYHHENDGIAADRIWSRLKREAIERAAGVA